MQDVFYTDLKSLVLRSLIRFSSSSGSRKREPQRLPFSNAQMRNLRSAHPSRRSHHFTGMQTTSANLDLGDLAIDDDSRDLQVRLPRPARPVVGVRDIVAEGNSLVADITAVSLDLCH